MGLMEAYCPSAGTMSTTHSAPVFPSLLQNLPGSRSPLILPSALPCGAAQQSCPFYLPCLIPSICPFFASLLWRLPESWLSSLATWSGPCTARAKSL